MNAVEQLRELLIEVGFPPDAIMGMSGDEILTKGRARLIRAGYDLSEILEDVGPPENAQPVIESVANQDQSVTVPLAGLRQAANTLGQLFGEVYTRPGPIDFAELANFTSSIMAAAKDEIERLRIEVARSVQFTPPVAAPGATVWVIQGDDTREAELIEVSQRAERVITANGRSDSPGGHLYTCRIKSSSELVTVGVFELLSEQDGV